MRNGRCEEVPDRPHILWLVSEDNSCFVGCYGDDLARTPTIDLLADEGLRFDRAFAVAPVCAPSRFSIITGCFPASVPGAEHMRADVPLPESVEPFTVQLRRAGYFCTNASKTDYNAQVKLEEAWDECDESAHWRHRPAGAPFFSVFNYMETHESCLFGDDSAPQTDPAAVRVPPYLPDTPTVRADLARYYDHIAALDAQLLDRLAELHADGLDEDTIVFYYSDHGGIHGRSKRFCYDSGLRVPLVARVPLRWRAWLGVEPGPVTEFVTLMDLGPTTLSLAGIAPPAHMHGRAVLGPYRTQAPGVAIGGRARMDERDDLVRTVRDDRYRYVRNYMPCRPDGQHVQYMWQQDSLPEWEQLHLEGRLTPTQDRFWQHRGHEELYDLVNDPDEVNDLANDPGHAEVLARLRERLDDHMLTIGDQGFRPEGGDPADPYPLATIMDVATRAARHRPVDPSLHRHPSESVRVWAARAVAASACDGDGPRPMSGPSADLLTTALADPSDAVRMIAAEALATPPALEAILEQYRSSSGVVQTRAAAALDRLLTQGRLGAEPAARVRTILRSEEPVPADPRVLKLREHALSTS